MSSRKTKKKSTGSSSSIKKKKKTKRKRSSDEGEEDAETEEKPARKRVTRGKATSTVHVTPHMNPVHAPDALPPPMSLAPPSSPPPPVVLVVVEEKKMCDAETMTDAGPVDDDQDALIIKNSELLKELTQMKLRLESIVSSSSSSVPSPPSFKVQEEVSQTGLHGGQVVLGRYTCCCQTIDNLSPCPL